jgi:hypothetical protein
VSNTSLATGIRSGTFALVNDGTFTATGNGGGSWFTPTTVAVGSSWWAKATVTTNTTTTFTGNTSSWIQLTTGANWGMQNTSSNAEGTGSFTIAFSPDGGTTTVGSMNVSWDVGYTP